MSSQLNIAPINPASTWSQSLAHQSVGAGVKAALSLARGDRASDVLTQGALSTIAQTGMQQGASGIGALYGNGDLDGLTHKILHGMNGAAAGALMNPGSMSNSAFAGALGAMVAESFAEIAKPDPVAFQATMRDRAAREGVDLRDESARYALVRDELSVVIGAGETVSATVAAVLGKDPTMAALSARNALENNMAQTMTAIAVAGPRLLQAARLAWRAKNAMDAAEDMGTGVETFPGGDEVGETGQREGYEGAPQDRTGADVEGYAPAVPSSTQEGFDIADDAPDMRILTSQEDYADRLNALMASEDLSRIETTVLLNDLKAVGAVLGDSPAARLIAPQVMEAGKVGMNPAGRAIRGDAIPAGSKMEYVGPGKVKFDGVEFRAVRDLNHLSDGELQSMLKGRNPVDIKGMRLDGHHHLQRFHRDPGAFVVEIPDPKHCISNPVQHPLGTKGGLTKPERADWDKLRTAFNKERAKTELARRGVQ